MSILSRENLNDSWGPYIEFIKLDSSLNVDKNDWPSKKLYKDKVFFEMSYDLLGTYCSICQLYAFFDEYEFVEIKEPSEILDFSSKLLDWASYLGRCNDRAFHQDFGMYKTLDFYKDINEKEAMRVFRIDLINTLLYISEKINMIAYEKKILGIVGI